MCFHENSMDILGSKSIKQTFLLTLVIGFLVATFMVYNFLVTNGQISLSSTGDSRGIVGMSLTSFLQSHAWRNISGEADIRHTLLFSLDQEHNLDSTNLEKCPGIPPNLKGLLSVIHDHFDFESLESLYPDIHGRLRPKSCSPKQKVAIIIPHRNRERHLLVLLHNLIPILQRQQADVTFIVVNQALPSTFNRAMLFNIGFVEASKLYPYDCFIFHDVDLIPMNDRIMYTCGKNPSLMSVAIDKFHFRPLGPEAFGGVTSLTREHILRINGASNLYFGWGGEDDDLWRRIYGSNLKVVRYPPDIARYSMIKHARDVKNEINPYRHQLLKSSTSRMHKDGLNTLAGLYTRLALQVTKLFLWIDVQVDQETISKVNKIKLPISRIRIEKLKEKIKTEPALRNK